MITTVLDAAAPAAAAVDRAAGCTPATCRIGLLARRGDRSYVLTCSAGYARVPRALDALQVATRGAAAAFPAILDAEHSC